MRFYGLYEGHDEIMRKMYVRLHGLSAEQREREDYDRCYSGELFSDRQRLWDIEYDTAGNYIPQIQRKPNFQDPIGREIVDSFAAGIFGTDKFPTITVKTFKDIYPSTDLIQLAIDKGEIEKEKVDAMNDYQKKQLKIKLCNQELNHLANSILTKPFLNPKMLEAARFGLIQGESILFIKVIDGIFFIEVIDRKTVTSIKMSERRPDRIESMTQMYMYQDTDPRDVTQLTTYWYRRDFTETEEIVYKPILERETKGLPETFKWERDTKLSNKHDMGFCPAVLFEAPLKRSIFYKQIDNIKAYTYFTNNIYSGLRNTMVPRWAVMFTPEGALNDQNFAPKKANEMMAFVGATDVKAISPSTQGFDTAIKFGKELERKIMKACRVFQDFAPSNQQSGKAIAMRIAPEIEAIGEFQICFGDKGMVAVCEMILQMMIILNNRGEDVMLRTDAMIPEVFNCIVSLGFGSVLPVTEETVLAAVTTALTAYKGGLIDLEHAVKYIAQYFNIVDTEDMIKKIQEKMRELLESEEEAQVIMNQLKDYTRNEDPKMKYGRLVHKINKGNKELMKEGIDTSNIDTSEIDNNEH